MQTDEQELELIRRAAAGEAAALERLLLRYRVRLFGYLSRHLPAPLRRVVDPQDVLQDTYFEAFRSIGQFTARDARSAWQWLITIARNRTIDIQRRVLAEKRCPQGDLPTGPDTTYDSVLLLLADLAAYERTPSQSAVSHELLATCQQMIGRLPNDNAQAIRLHYMEGLSIAQAAERMGRTPMTVKMLCHRGLKYLREMMRSMSRYA